MTDTPAEHAHALALLCNGTTAQQAAAETGIPLGRLVQLARRHGWNIHPTTGLAIDPTQPDNKPVLPDGITPTLTALPGVQPADEAASSSADELINHARECDDRHVQAALRHTETALTKLRETWSAASTRIAAAQQAETERAAALAEIADLEQKLAAARERARQVGAKPKRATTAAGKTPPVNSTAPPDNPGPTDRQIRAWAHEHGVPCPPLGRISQALRDQYTAEVSP